MQIPQTNIVLPATRQLMTSNIDELARFQHNKNRHYIQLQSGKFSANYIEANLGAVQVFKEYLNIGATIEAAPPSSYLPFGIILPHSGDHRYCGRPKLSNSFFQASGGAWDIFFKNRLEYICTAFSRQYFLESYELLTASPPPSEHFISKAIQTTSGALTQYTMGVSRILQRVLSSPILLEKEKIKHLLCSELFKLTLNALLPTTHLKCTILPQPKRIKGVQRVVDYLQENAALLPDMQTLCRVSELSERSLEYGFQEYFGITPTRYLRNLRLNGVRLELLKTLNKKIKISDVALSWGFLELGRFSGEYKYLFQELPSQTLRRERI